MHALLYGLVVGTVGLTGAAGLLALTRLVLVQVRDLTRVACQLSTLHEEPAGRWEFGDCGQAPGWLAPRQRPGGGLEPWRRDGWS
jgi:hypothetical protein